MIIQLIIQPILLLACLSLIAWPVLDVFTGRRRPATTHYLRSACLFLGLAILNLITVMRGGGMYAVTAASLFAVASAIQVHLYLRARRNEAAAEANG